MGRITPPVVNPVARSAPTVARSSRTALRSIEVSMSSAMTVIMEEKSRMTTDVRLTDIWLAMDTVVRVMSQVAVTSRCVRTSLTTVSSPAASVRTLMSVNGTQPGARFSCRAPAASPSAAARRPATCSRAWDSSCR